MKLRILSYVIVLASISVGCQTADKYLLKKLLNRLEKIKTISYFYYQTATLPYDTIPSVSYSTFKKEYINPEDEYVGASIASFLINDTSKLEYFYDGKSKAYLNWTNKTIPVDSFENNEHPFRIVYPPIITHVKSLLKYALETTDNISISVIEHADSVIIALFIKNKMPEVVGNRIVYAEIPYLTPSESFVKYEIFFSCKNILPTKIVRRLPDKICWETCKYISINEDLPESLYPGNYFPSDFKIDSQHKKGNESNLDLGQVAPDWILEDLNSELFSLNEMKSKVIIMQFTGLGCGPCETSVPYMKKISREYNRDLLELVAIETWSNNKTAVRKHLLKHDIQYKYLFANDKFRQDYRVADGVPKFVILDKKKVIRKVIIGFSRENTINEINTTISQIISE